MDTDRKEKYQKESRDRANKLWENFLAEMSKLGYVPNGNIQEIQFRHIKNKKHAVSGLLQLKIAEDKKA